VVVWAREGTRLRLGCNVLDLVVAEVTFNARISPSGIASKLRIPDPRRTLLASSLDLSLWVAAMGSSQDEEISLSDQ
jgi:hypothetical protein